MFKCARYLLGSGNSSTVPAEAVNATVLNTLAAKCKLHRATISKFAGAGPQKDRSSAAPALWLGEGGGAYGSGADGTTNTFLSTFWHVKQHNEKHTTGNTQVAANLRRRGSTRRERMAVVVGGNQRVVRSTVTRCSPLLSLSALTGSVTRWARLPCRATTASAARRSLEATTPCFRLRHRLRCRHPLPTRALSPGLARQLRWRVVAS